MENKTLDLATMYDQAQAHDSQYKTHSYSGASSSHLLSVQYENVVNISKVELKSVLIVSAT